MRINILKDSLYHELKRNYEIESRRLDPGTSSYKKALQELRTYLDAYGCKMPKPLYPYDSANPETLKFKDGTVYLEGNKVKFREKLNPKFKYNHLV